MTDQSRIPAHDIDSVFVERWSPRAFDKTPVPQSDLDRILEAARWAPSAFNVQPWRFVYAHRDTPHWEKLLSALVPFNQDWAKNAGVLLFVISDTLVDTPTGETKPFPSHSFDTGASWSALAHQATRLGYHTHGMTGIDFDAARAVLNLPERFSVEAAVAIGRQGDASSLPDALREREAPSDRKPLSEIAFEGSFAA